MKKINQMLTIVIAMIIVNVNSMKAETGNLMPENDWQLKQEANGVKFYVKIDSCGGGSQLYFKLRIENTNLTVVKVSYTLVPLDLPASAPVHGVIESLAAGASVETNCSDSNDKLKVIMLPPASTIADLELLYKVE